MAGKITDMTAETSIDRSADYLEVYDASANATRRANVNSLLGGISGAPVATTDTQTLTNKTLTSPTISSPTLSGTITGTYTLGGTPTFPAAVVTLTGTQTLTNKTLTSPTINTATIANPTLTVDAISEFTSAAGVTIDGVLLKDSKVSGTYISDDSITGAQINWSTTGADAGIWWEELGRASLSSTADSVSVTPIAARKYLRILIYTVTSGATTVQLRFNNDSASNYSYRYSANGGADSTSTSQAVVVLATSETSNRFADVRVINISAQEKLVIGHTVSYGSSGAGNAPTRWENTGKWANTSAQITRVDVVNDAAGDFASGTEVVVLGHN